MILVDANQNIWERRWFVLRRYCRVTLSSLVSGAHALLRPYLHVYKHSNEVEEITVISLDGVNVESNSDMESLLGVRTDRLLFFAYVMLTYRRNGLPSHSLPPQTRTHWRRRASRNYMHGPLSLILHVYHPNISPLSLIGFLDAGY
jgi:hypothetical protein